MAPDSDSENYFTSTTPSSSSGRNHLLGGGREAQLKYVSIGQEEEETDGSGSIISTNTAITLRWYF